MKYNIKSFSQLKEASRNSLIDKSKSSHKGKQRFQRRVKSSIATSVKQYNSIDMNKLFKNNILTIGIQIKGETDDYVVKISMGGFLDSLHNEIERETTANLKAIIKALINSFNKDDVYINCQCPDFFYRFGYWATRNKFNTAYLNNRQIKWKDKAFLAGKSRTNYSGVGDPQTIPSDITNPNDTLGSACKHTLLVLSNTNWIMKVASVISNYIKYMEKHQQRVYADIIYPAIYQTKYDDAVQRDLFDKGRQYAKTGKDTLNKANTHTGRDDKGKFNPNNPYKMQKRETDKIDPNQMTLFNDDELDKL